MTMDTQTLAGAYQASTVNYGNTFSPLIVNDDGSVSIAGTLVPAAFDGGTNTLTINSCVVNQVTIAGGRATFQETGGVMKFLGALTIGGNSNPYVGEELVAFKSPSLANTVDALGAFDSGDGMMITASNGQWVGNGSADGVLGTGPDKPGFFYSVEKTDSGIKINYDGYQYWAGELGGPIHYDATADAATVFNVRTTLDGAAILMAQNGGYVALAPDGSLTLANETYLSLPMEFGLHLQPVEPNVLLERWGINTSEVEVTPCEVDIAYLCWQCTGGLFLALGLGPYMVTNEVRVGVMGVLRSNPTVWQAVTSAATTLAANPRTGPLVWAAVTGILSAAWNAGLLWKLVKLVLSFIGWWIVFRVVAKVLELIFLLEVEVAELLASFIVWAGVLIQIAVSLAKDCGHMLTADFQPPGLPATG